ncbi:MAG: ATP-dependent helicase [Nocardioidaceae bacterium]|nr:ATP-dependent helicase [Nocardioidaceae bacterium]
MSVTYRLERRSPALAKPPQLDEAQQAVVDHPGGPLLVLAGPGTGKTTTLVEAVVERIEHRGSRPDQVLVLTFSRKAAAELRDRITGRLGRTSSTPLSSTFHSFCYGLVRHWQPAELYAGPLRLLSAPEQDVVLRELLTHSRESGKTQWPASLERALGTRGFAREVHAVLARARERGLEPADLTRIGHESGRPEWVAAGAFMEDYVDVLDWGGSIDYSELIHRAVLLAETPEVQADLRSRYAAVFVDEYQDTDPSQVRLLQAIAGNGRDLVVVGDPDQSIYAFRGADVGGILEFPTQFLRADRRPAEVVSLATTRRFGSRLLAASRRVAAGIGVRGAIDRETFERFRNPEPHGSAYGDGKLEVFTFSSSGAETDHIADILRRAHLEDGIPWSEMAVLVRSGVNSIPALRRALVGTGVPVEVAGDELPLRREPAVQTLLSALRCSLDPSRLDVELTRSLLMSPLGDLDAAQVRRLGRQLRSRERAAEDGERLPRPSGELLRQALGDPVLLADLDSDGTGAVKAAKLGHLLAKARRQLDDGAPAEEVLWSLWSGTTWPYRLRAAVERGGAAARAGHRDLDAVCALFEVAARSEEKRERTGVTAFLDQIEAQQIPGDTLADRGVRGDAVRLLTAHRSKGLEWRLVVVASVQEGSWPDLRRRGTLLQADRLGADGIVEPTTPMAMMAEERRLFYVAVTRAKQRLVVTAVASPEPDGDQPSRLLTDLRQTIQHRPGRPRRPLSLAGVVGELRRVTADPAASDALRTAAAARLVRLAECSVQGEPVSGFAHPAGWWGLRADSTAADAVRPLDQPLQLSASALTGLKDCALRWFLSREASGESARSTSLGFGSVLHVLAEHLGSGETADPDDMIKHLDGVWDQLQFASPWIGRRERAAAEEAIRRFARWHNSRPHRTLVGSEIPFEVETQLDDGERVVLRGRVDRLEKDAGGRVVVVDFKTSKNPPTGPQVAADVQLGLYQLVVETDGFADELGDGARSGGAELVQLRTDATGLPKVQHQPPPVPDEEGRMPVEVHLTKAVRSVRDEAFSATENDYCSLCTFVRICPAQQRGGSVLA